MFSRSRRIANEARDDHAVAIGSEARPARSKLDAAILAAVLAMGTLNLLVMTDQFGATKAYAAPVASCGNAVAGARLA